MSTAAWRPTSANASAMKISTFDLLTQTHVAARLWPVIAEANRIYGLPPYMLYAVGSRETNLTNERGDNGHGHGIFQLDDRSHIIPEGFDNNVEMQSLYAARMLAALFNKYQTWVPALNEYNSGSPFSVDTTGGDYGNDVQERQTSLLQQMGPPVSDPVWDTLISNHYHDTNPASAPLLTAAELLSWAATHAAHATEEGAKILAAFTALRTELPLLIEQAIKDSVINVSIVTGVH